MSSCLLARALLRLGGCGASGGPVVRPRVAVLLTFGCADAPVSVCLDGSLRACYVFWRCYLSSRTVFQSVKEVLQSLVDDGVVSSDKCGVQTVFWCLPSEAVQKVGWRSSPSIFCGRDVDVASFSFPASVAFVDIGVAVNAF